MEDIKDLIGKKPANHELFVHASVYDWYLQQNGTGAHEKTFCSVTLDRNPAKILVKRCFAFLLCIVIGMLAKLHHVPKPSNWRRSKICDLLTTPELILAFCSARMLKTY